MKRNQNVNVSRRNLLKLSTGIIGTGILTTGLRSKFVFSQKALAENNMSPDRALQDLIDGNKRFTTRHRQNSHQDYVHILQVAKAQTPFASILSCADSRVPSEIIFDQGFGDLFVCRVAGNIATPEEIGSLEFGSLVLGSKVILVMGHKRCGAVAATIKGTEVPGQISSLLTAIKPSVEKSKNQPGDPVENACKANVLIQVDKLKSSPVISQLIDAGKLKVAAGYYDLDNGKVTLIA